MQNVICPYCGNGKMSRNKAYKLLSSRMGIPENMTHIGMFDIDQCMRVVTISKAEMRARL